MKTESYHIGGVVRVAALEDGTEAHELEVAAGVVGGVGATSDEAGRHIIS